MFIEYVTALVISYNISIDGELHDVTSHIWFKNQDECQEVFQYNAKLSKSVDNLYAHLRNIYGKDIMMGCRQTEIVSKPLNVPPPRPKELEN
jgi:hypothetical protein